MFLKNLNYLLNLRNQMKQIDHLHLRYLKYQLNLNYLKRHLNPKHRMFLKNLNYLLNLRNQMKQILHLHQKNQ
jgi:hypothetical protein